MQKHILEDKAIQLVMQANQYFKETYSIHSFYDIHSFFEDHFIVFCNAVPEENPYRDSGGYYTGVDDCEDPMITDREHNYNTEKVVLL